MTVAEDPAEPGELDFLRFFFSEAGEAFGPADHDIYCLIMEGYESSTGQQVPAQYRVGYLTTEEEEDPE